MPVGVVQRVVEAAADVGDGSHGELPGLPPLAQYGLLGVFIAAAFMRKIVLGWTYDRMEKDYEVRLTKLEAERDEYRAENRELVKLNFETQQKVLPALEASSRALEEATFMIEQRRRRDQDG